MADTDTPIYFGKHKGETWAAVARSDPWYLEWIITHEPPFRARTRRLAAEALSGPGEVARPARLAASPKRDADDGFEWIDVDTMTVMPRRS